MRMRIGLLVALTAMLSAVASVAGAAGMETDPASVSEGLKAIFKYGNTTRQTAERLKMMHGGCSSAGRAFSSWS